MILPARMSGAEKRERMAIMEAAISSTMAHPNIVQVGLTAAECLKTAPASSCLIAVVGTAYRTSFSEPKALAVAVVSVLSASCVVTVQ
jgi:hypothetical protein